MSGLQSSISTLISREYHYPDGHWGPNINLFIRAVGAHPDRLNNLYFTFLFLLRAVMKAGDYLSEYQYLTGNIEDDAQVTELIQRLVKARIPFMTPENKGENNAISSSSLPLPLSYMEALEGLVLTEGKGKDTDYRGINSNKTTLNSTVSGDGFKAGNKRMKRNVLEECRNGFDESVLFQVIIIE